MCRKSFCALLFAVAALAVSSSPLAAHHGDAGRYVEEVIVVKGTVLAVQMLNPHSMIVFEVTEPDGKKVRWQAEMGAPQALMRDFGWTKETLKAGDQITLTGRRPKSGAPYLNLTERANVVMTESGKEIFRTANYGQPAPQ
jgi:hypothetical protein